MSSYGLVENDATPSLCKSFGVCRAAELPHGMPCTIDKNFAVVSPNVESFHVHEITDFVALFVLAEFSNTVGRGNQVIARPTFPALRQIF